MTPEELEQLLKGIVDSAGDTVKLTDKLQVLRDKYPTTATPPADANDWKEKYDTLHQQFVERFFANTKPVSQTDPKPDSKPAGDEASNKPLLFDSLFGKKGS